MTDDPRVKAIEELVKQVQDAFAREQLLWEKQNSAMMAGGDSGYSAWVQKWRDNHDASRRWAPELAGHLAFLLEDRKRLIQERDRAIAGHERHNDGLDDIWDADIKAGRKEFASARLRELLHKCELEHRRVLHEFELSKSARDKQAKVEVQLFTRVEAAESEVARLKAVIAAAETKITEHEGRHPDRYQSCDYHYVRQALAEVRAALSAGNGEPR